MTPEEKAVIQAAVDHEVQGECGHRTPLSDAVSALVASQGKPAAEWMPATFGDVLPGDRIRLGQEETEVRKAHRGPWHAKSRQWVDDKGKTRDHQTPWEHEELRLDLAAVPGMRVYQPDLECEILCDAERAAILLLQRGFPGSTIVS